MKDFQVENICYNSSFCKNNKPFKTVHIVAVSLDLKTFLVGTTCTFDPTGGMR